MHCNWRYVLKEQISRGNENTNFVCFWFFFFWAILPSSWWRYAGVFDMALLQRGSHTRLRQKPYLHARFRRKKSAVKVLYFYKARIWNISKWLESRFYIIFTQLTKMGYLHKQMIYQKFKFSSAWSNKYLPKRIWMKKNIHT